MKREDNLVRDLMIPRVEVIARYPASRFEIGQILSFGSFIDEQQKTRPYHKYTESEPIHLDDSNLSLFPAIFRRLHWWERREAWEMPKCIQFEKDSVITVKRITYLRIKNWDYESVVDALNSKGINLRKFKPSTSAEYYRHREAIRSGIGSNANTLKNEQ